ncbi:MAG: hypothetical protein IPL84_16885 [Chitinophagaceae bacterium]|nr:hypothetical protein [Chitinophagaceae bacterium]
MVVPGASGTSLLIDVDKLGTYTSRATTGAGFTALSAVVTITADSSNQLFITPNPNNGQFKVRFHTSANSLGFNQRIVMYGENAQRVFDQSYPITASYSAMNVDARILPRGIYVLVLFDAFGNEILGRSKIVIQ